METLALDRFDERFRGVAVHFELDAGELPFSTDVNRLRDVLGEFAEPRPNVRSDLRGVVEEVV